MFSACMNMYVGMFMLVFALVGELVYFTYSLPSGVFLYVAFPMNAFVQVFMYI